MVKIRDKAATQIGCRWVNHVKTVLSLIFAWGVERGHLAANPVFKIKLLKRPKGAPEANRPWHNFERDLVINSLPAHMRVPVMLMMFWHSIPAIL